MMRDHIHGNEPATQPLNGVAFQLYLQRHNLSPLDVALTAGVRYMTIWRMTRALPIRRKDETRVCRALFRLTGEWFTTPILTHTDLSNPPPQRHS
jgi:hypothetical protein